MLIESCCTHWCGLPSAISRNNERESLCIPDTEFHAVEMFIMALEVKSLPQHKIHFSQ